MWVCVWVFVWFVFVFLLLFVVVLFFFGGGGGGVFFVCGLFIVFLCLFICLFFQLSTTMQWANKIDFHGERYTERDNAPSYVAPRSCTMLSSNAMLMARFMTKKVCSSKDTTSMKDSSMSQIVIRLAKSLCLKVKTIGSSTVSRHFSSIGRHKNHT